MDLKKLIEDFNEVKKKVTDEIDINEEFSYRARCHERAYLINTGLLKKGYNSIIENGYAPDFWKGGQVYHSWVMVSGSLGRLNGVILDVQHNHNSICCLFGKIYLKEKVVTGLFGKLKYKRDVKRYKLDEETFNIAKKLFD
jgi:hypothetical protein